MRTSLPIVAVVLAAALAVAAPPVARPTQLPAFRLNDPLGQAFTDAELTSRGAIVVVTAPTQAQANAQFAWSDAFKATPAVPGQPRVLWLEDMSQSFFRPIVLARMREGYHSGGRTVLLLDEDGATRKKLGVPENATVAFAVSPTGALVAVETGPGSIERVEALLRAVSSTAPAVASGADVARVPPVSTTR